MYRSMYRSRSVGSLVGIGTCNVTVAWDHSAMSTPRHASHHHDAMLDVNAAAQMLGVTTRFVRRLVDERRIPFHKIGKFVRISSRDIEAFIETSRVESRR